MELEALRPNVFCGIDWGAEDYYYVALGSTWAGLSWPGYVSATTRPEGHCLLVLLAAAW